MEIQQSCHCPDPGTGISAAREHFQANLQMPLQFKGSGVRFIELTPTN